MPKNRSSHPDDELDNADTAASDSLSNLPYDELQQKLAEVEQKNSEQWERILRMQAEADNASRRAEREVANAHKYAIDKFVGELLPIVDSLELCIANESTADQATASVVEGVQMTLNMFYAAMEKFGIEQVNPISEPFNPEYQQAISVQFDPKLKPGTVLSVLQKGYTLNNRLVRPALVVVSKAEN